MVGNLINNSTSSLVRGEFSLRPDALIGHRRRLLGAERACGLRVENAVAPIRAGPACASSFSRDKSDRGS